MLLEHNSRCEFYRTPFGAVKTGTEITLRLSVTDGGIPHSVKCVTQSASGTVYRDMVYVFTLSGASIYSCTFSAPDTPGLVRYWFEISNDSGAAFYGNNREYLGGMGEMYEKKPESLYQITVYSKDYKTPEWFKKSVAYQIFPDRFYNGNADGGFSGSRSDIIKRQWGEEPFCSPEEFGGEYLSNDFFGGNLKGIEEKLPYLKELGVSVIYLNPIFKAYSNHRYDTGDYELIDQTLGTEEDFVSLCSAAGDCGIKIILDGVFNHTGSNSKYFNKNGEYDSIGAYQSEASPYYSWYRFGETKEDYECWWGMKTLPHTEESSKSFQEYITTGDNSIIKKWLRLGASGWRLDVVDELPGFFVKLLREGVKSVSPEAVLIGEVWEDASNKVSYGEEREYFLGSELDSVMNYPLRNAIIGAVLGTIDAKGLSNRIMSLKENYPPQAFYSCLNMLSSHDIERLIMAVSDVSKPEGRREQAVYRLSPDARERAEKRAILATALQMTLPGVPCVYYGDEAGMEGFADPSCRRCFDWNNTDNEYSREFKKWINLRNSSAVFSEGEFESLYTIGNVLAFGRFTDKEKYIVVANFSDKDEKIRLDAGRLGITSLEADGATLKSESGIFWLDTKAGTATVYAGCN
ncbi:MAG: glycoside hydrolase family 13 protein [Clostridia bacterium]|nr:glycoside hydrolase family 13 protein [Clostridia bacterium]